MRAKTIWKAIGNLHDTDEFLIKKNPNLGSYVTHQLRELLRVREDALMDSTKYEVTDVKPITDGDTSGDQNAFDHH